MAKTVYIAGKITGDPKYKEKFDNVQHTLEEQGYIVLSPACLPEGFEYEAYMRITGAMLCECSEVCFLPDWKDSTGAVREFSYANALSKKVWFYDDGISRG